MPKKLLIAPLVLCVCAAPLAGAIASDSTPEQLSVGSAAAVVPSGGRRPRPIAATT
jgi:hypothetical protein